MKYLVLVFFLYTIPNCIISQNLVNTIQFVSDNNFYKIDNTGKIVKGPISLNGRVYFGNKVYIQNGKPTPLIEIDGIERFFENTNDTIQEFITTPQLMAIIKHNGYFGIINQKGDWIVPNKYEGIYAYFFNGEIPIFSVKLNNKYTLLKVDGTSLSNTSYDLITRNWYEHLNVMNNEKYGLADSTGKQITDLIYDELQDVRGNRCWFKKGEKYGLLNSNGKEILPATLTNKPEDFYFTYSTFFEYNKDGYTRRYGVIDSNGKQIVPAIYDGINIDDCGFIVHNEYKHGLISKDGKLLLPLVYESINYSTETNVIRATNKINSYYLFKNNKLSPLAKEPETKKEKVTKIVTINKKQGIKDKNGKLLVACKYQKIIEFDSTSFIYFEKGKFVLAQINKATTNPVKYQHLVYINDYDVILAEKDNKWGLITNKGEIKVPFEYDRLLPYNKTLFKLDIDDSSYYLLCNSYFDFFSDSLTNLSSLPSKSFYAIKNNKVGYIDASGKEVIPIMYEDIYRFYNNTALAFNSEKYSIIDATNKEIYSLNRSKNDSVYRLYKTGYVTKISGKYGVISAQGKPILPNEYDSIIDGDYERGDKYYYAKNNLGYTVIDSTGRVLIRNSKTKPNSFSGNFALSIIYGQITSICNKEGKQIWQNPYKKFSTQNYGNGDNSICELSDLEEARFVGNDWDHSFHLPNCFYELKNLKRIEILYSDIDSIPDAICNFTQLHYFETSSHALKYVSPKLGELKNLDTLIITSSVDLPNEISKLNKLNYLYAATSKLGANKTLNNIHIYAQAVPPNIDEFTSLKTFNFYLSSSLQNENGTEVNIDSTLTTAVKCISKHKGLETLILNNESSAWTQVFIANENLIKSMTKLKEIKISNLYDRDKEELQKIFKDITITGVNW